MFCGALSTQRRAGPEADLAGEFADDLNDGIVHIHDLLRVGVQ
jgi:hypothetical protein